MIAEDYNIPAVREALRAKIAADKDWLEFMSADSEQRTAARKAGA